MKRVSNGLISLACLFGPAIVLAGCQTDKHTMVQPKEGTVIACSKCYDEVYKTQHYSGSRWGATITQTRTRHMCPECKSETTIYMQDGVAMVRCELCAPDGVPCDKCVAPAGWTPPK